ncbi:hypothetical protein CLF_108156 [Clonorchis sinensis]|uniref:Uncharacterized protein n=1 Tax=Clonorchis sinensis TaxID=79923 RepID=G7YRB1_CLOSI|nr:hypothetical protein CLF_108156 [Clonorchis sinensis]
MNWLVNIKGKMAPKFSTEIVDWKDGRNNEEQPIWLATIQLVEVVRTNFQRKRSHRVICWPSSANQPWAQLEHVDVNHRWRAEIQDCCFLWGTPLDPDRAITHDRTFVITDGMSARHPIVCAFVKSEHFASMHKLFGLFMEIIGKQYGVQNVFMGRLPHVGIRDANAISLGSAKNPGKRLLRYKRSLSNDYKIHTGSERARGRTPILRTRCIDESKGRPRALVDSETSVIGEQYAPNLLPSMRSHPVPRLTGHTSNMSEPLYRPHHPICRRSNLYQLETTSLVIRLTADEPD